MKKRKNPFSKSETSWLRKAADEHGGRIGQSTSESIEALFEDEESAEKFKEAVENAREEVPSLKAIDESRLYDQETDELVDVMVTVHGSEPPKVKNSLDLTTYALLAAAGVVVYLIYKNYTVQIAK